MNIKLLKLQLEELKTAIILNEHAYDDNLEDRHFDMIQCMKELHGNLETILKLNKE